ncbi:hypothetical protein EV715DRAFT_296412 [Schizophyllum commune]
MSHPVPSKSREDVQLCNRCNHTYSLSFQIPDVASLRIGYLPTTTEARLICDAIAETDDSMKEIDQELERLSGYWKHLDALRRSLEYSQDVRRALVAPIRRLPTEILSEIFQACCGDAIEIAHERCEPLVLGSVCKSWRDTIVDMPTLWAGFTFPWGLDSHYKTLTSLVTRLRTFLKYSGSHRDLCKGNEKNLSHIPSLRSLLISLETESDANIMPNLPWEQLECLHTHGPPLYSLNILRRCPNVVEWCYKHTWHRASSLPIPDIVITLPRLRKPSSEIVEPADAAILNFLEAPSVEILALDCSTAP